MGWISKAKSDVATNAAFKAHADGRAVYMHRIHVGMTQPGVSGQLAGFAEQIEAIESAGWRLDHMSFVGEHNKERGFFLFRRANNAG